MVSLFIDIILKSIDVFLLGSKYKNDVKKNFLGFVKKYDAGVKTNVKIKKRYDETMEKLRKGS